MQQLRFVGSAPEVLFAVGGLRQDGDEVSGSMELGSWSTGPDGRPAVGALGVLVDEVAGYALMASLDQGAWSISTEIWIDVVGEIPGPGGSVTACAAPVQAGSFAAGQVHDSAGRLVLQCRQRGRAVGAEGVSAGDSPAGAAASSSPDLASMLELRPRGGGYLMEASAALLNPRRMLHGGVSLAASEVVAQTSRLAEGCALPTTSVHIVHTWGVPAGATVTFVARTRHAGRTLWITDVVGSVADRTCTLATVTAGALT